MCEGRESIEAVGENYRRPAVGRLFAQWGMPEGGVKMATAHLVPEPTNKHDRHAVKVVIEGHHVAYVPSEDAAGVGHQCRKVPRGAVAATPARVWGSNEDGEWRARVTLVFDGEGSPERDFRAERVARREAQVRDEASRRVGQVRGQWWATHRGAISELKRQDRHEEALDLLRECIAAAARVAVALDEPPTVWPTEQAAVILRKVKDAAGEVQVLEAYVASLGAHPVPDKIAERLAKARVLAQRP